MEFREEEHPAFADKVCRLAKHADKVCRKLQRRRWRSLPSMLDEGEQHLQEQQEEMEGEKEEQEQEMEQQEEEHPAFVDDVSQLQPAEEM